MSGQLITVTISNAPKICDPLSDEDKHQFDQIKKIQVLWVIRQYVGNVIGQLRGWFAFILLCAIASMLLL